MIVRLRLVSVVCEGEYVEKGGRCLVRGRRGFVGGGRGGGRCKLRRA